METLVTSVMYALLVVIGIMIVAAVLSATIRGVKLLARRVRHHHDTPLHH